MTDPARNDLGRFHGAVRNAVLWGLGFGAIGLLVSLPALPDETPGGMLRWQIVASLAVRFAIFGVLCGALFWWVTGLLFERAAFARFGRVPVSLGGAVGTAVFVPLFMQTMNLLSGEGPVPWPLVLDDSVWAFVFGGAAALGSLELTRRRIAPPA